MRAAGCLGFGVLAFITFIVSIVIWPLILVAFGFLIAAIVMLCIPEQPRPPHVVDPTRPDAVGRTAMAVLPLVGAQTDVNYSMRAVGSVVADGIVRGQPA